MIPYRGIAFLKPPRGLSGRACSCVKSQTILGFDAWSPNTSFNYFWRGIALIGRAADSKSVGWGFESLCPCQKYFLNIYLKIKAEPSNLLMVGSSVYAPQMFHRGCSTVKLKPSVNFVSTFPGFHLRRLEQRPE